MQAGKKLWVKCDATKDHMTTGCGATNRIPLETWGSTAPKLVNDYWKRLVKAA